MQNQPSRFPRHLVWISALVTAVWWIRYQPYLPLTLEYPRFNSDSTQHHFWMHRFHDPELFPGDMIADFFAAPGICMPLYRGLYEWLCSFLSVTMATQFVTLGLLIASLILFDRLLYKAGASRSARVLGLLVFLFIYKHRIEGLARSFHVPFMLLQAWLLVNGRWFLATASLPLQFLIYPSVTVLNAGFTGLAMVWHLPGRWRSSGVSGCLAGLTERSLLLKGGFLFLVLAGILAAHMWIGSAPERTVFGEPVTLEQAKQMPEFYPGGRAEYFFEDFRRTWLSNTRSGMDIYKPMRFLAILAVVWVVGGFKRLTVPKEALQLVAASFILYFLAHLVLFKLYHPNRYTFQSLGLAAVWVLGANLDPFIERVRWLWQKTVGDRLRISLRPWEWCFVGMALMVTLIYNLDFPTTSKPGQKSFEMIRAVAGLPKDTMVAGYPRYMNDIPIMAKRSVLVNEETSLPYFPAYWNVLKERTWDFFDAYYAPDFAAVEAFAAKHKVGALVVARWTFGAGFITNEKSYIEPFASELAERLAGRQDFALLNPPRERVLFDNGAYYILGFGPLAPDSGG
jgi:hypothetical protein